MTTLNSALSFNFASGESARLAQAERSAQEALANQLAQNTPSSAFVVGSTITARYQYRVAQDGSLIPLQTQITTDAPQDGQRNEGSRRANRSAARDEREQSLRDLLRSRIALSPSDELTLFASTSNIEQVAQQATRQQPLSPLLSEAAIAAQASDENGEIVEAQVLTFRRQNTEELQRQRAQFSVANLYARNNDVVYNVTPISQIAA